MKARTKSLEYLDQLIGKMDEIDKIPSSTQKLQAKLDLRKLFEACYTEGYMEGVKEKKGSRPGRPSIEVR
jgi:hypothetical protein